jgi:hypothetical protein
VHRPRCHCLLPLAVCWLGLASLEGAPLPFVVVNPDGAWRIITVKRPFPPTYTVEVVVASPNKLPRFVVLSSPRQADDTESDLEFSQRLRLNLSPGQDPAVIENATKAKAGFEGRDLRFELANGNEQFRCELFVFSEEKTRWALLYLAAKDSPPEAKDPFLVFGKGTDVPPGVVAMEPFRVKDDPLTAFPISFEVESNLNAGRVKRIVVSNVPPNSLTDRAGVLVGDEIVSINGRKSQDFALGLGKKSELGLIFLNRSPGDEVDLEIKSAGEARTRKVTLRVAEISDGYSRFRR